MHWKGLKIPIRGQKLIFAIQNMGWVRGCAACQSEQALVSGSSTPCATGRPVIFAGIWIWLRSLFSSCTNKLLEGKRGGKDLSCGRKHILHLLTDKSSLRSIWKSLLWTFPAKPKIIYPVLLALMTGGFISCHVVNHSTSRLIKLGSHLYPVVDLWMIVSSLGGTFALKTARLLLGYFYYFFRCYSQYILKKLLLKII